MRPLIVFIFDLPLVGSNDSGSVRRSAKGGAFHFNFELLHCFLWIEAQPFELLGRGLPGVLVGPIILPDRRRHDVEPAVTVDLLMNEPFDKSGQRAQESLHLWRSFG